MPISKYDAKFGSRVKKNARPVCAVCNNLEETGIMVAETGVLYELQGFTCLYGEDVHFSNNALGTARMMLFGCSKHFIPLSI